MSVPAINALGKIADPKAIDVLFEALENEVVAEEAIEALASFQDPAIVQKLIAICGKSVPKVTAAAASALGHFPSPAVLACLVPLLKHSYPPVRQAALASLGRLEDPAAIPALLEALGDGEGEVVIGALQALQQIGIKDQPEVITRILEVFASSADPKIKASVLQIFHGVHTEAVFEIAKEALHDSNPRCRANAVELVHSFDDLPPRRKLSMLKPLVTPGENNRVLANVAIALGKVDTSSSVQILSGLLNSMEKWERASAVYAARYIQNDRVASWLTTLFTSEEDPDVLRNVLDSLAFFSGDDVTNCFVRALEHGNPLIRSGAAKSLGRIGDVSTTDQLLKLIDGEDDRSVICEILGALGRMGDTAHIHLISQYLQHTDLRVQANAIEALATLGTVEIVPYVEPFLNSSDNRVKANAAVAMWNAGSLQVVHALRDMIGSINLKLKVSAIYAVGEIGKSLNDLEDARKYFLLVSALKEANTEENDYEEPSSPSVPTVPSVPSLTPGGRPGGEPSPFEITQSFLVTGSPEQGSDFPLEVIEQFYALLQERKVKEAMAVVEAGLSMDPKNPYLNYLQADISRRKKQLGQACDGFCEVNGQDRFFLNSHLHLASIYADSQELRQSIEEYFRAVLVQLFVLQQEIETGLGLLKDRKVSEASLLLKSVVKQLPINSKLHFVAGKEFLKYKANERAFEHLSKAYVTSPNNGEILLSLAFACFKTRRFSMARMVCQKLTRLFTADSLLHRKAFDLLAVMDKAQK